MIEIDVNDRTPTKPCQTPGCNYPRYHCCIVGKPDLFAKFLNQEARREAQRRSWANGTRRHLDPRTQEHKDAISQGLRERWARHREEQAPLYARIVERYNQGDIGMNGLSKELGTSKGTVIKAIQIGRENGTVTFSRPRGRNIGFSLKEIA